MDERGTAETRKDEMRKQCQAFHAENPEVWELFVRFTFEVIERGFKNFSVNAVFERIRWETDQADTKGRSMFKLNNNYRPFYARRFAAMYPVHADFFRTRRQTSESKAATRMRELGPDDFE